MSADEGGLSLRADVLRDIFDQSFAAAPAVADDAFEGMLAIRICGDPYAVALTEVHGLFVDRKIVPLPGRSTQSMGITCLRTGIVAVYSLRALLGYPPADMPMRWLISAGERQGFALAFERLDAYARVPRSQFLTRATIERETHLRGTATIAGEQRSIISLTSIARSILNTSQRSNQ
jgi:purine-binding chemotaxis protein CheW